MVWGLAEIIGLKEMAREKITVSNEETRIKLPVRYRLNDTSRFNFATYYDADDVLIETPAIINALNKTADLEAKLAEMEAERDALLKTVDTLRPRPVPSRGDNDPDGICKCGHFRTQHSPCPGYDPSNKNLHYGCMAKCDCKKFKRKW